MRNILFTSILFVSTMSTAQNSINVTVSSNMFTPADITINVGDTVIWTNVQGNHNVNGTQVTYPSNPESFGNSVGSGWTYSHVFNTVGNYDYRCDPHVSFGMTGTVTVQSTVGIDTPNNISEIGFYPNPATDYLKFSNNSDLKAIAIYNITGVKLFQTKLVKSNLDISTLNSGIYFIKLTTNSGESTQKLIVK